MKIRRQVRKNDKITVLKTLAQNDEKFKQDFNTVANLKKDKRVTRKETQLIFKTLIPNIIRSLLQKDGNIILIIDTLTGLATTSTSNWASSELNKLQKTPVNGTKEEISKIISNLITGTIINNRSID